VVARGMTAQYIPIWEYVKQYFSGRALPGAINLG
jgi:hypothetical protein